MVKNVSLRAKPYLHAIVLFAWVLQAFIPLGFMPKAQAQEPFEIVICTMNGIETLMMDQDTDHSEGEQSSQCLYAPILIDDVKKAEMVEPFLIMGRAVQDQFHVSVLNSIENKPWFSQGPPTYS